MKKLFVILLTCTALKAYTQDTAQLIKQIDSTVFTINHSTLFATSHDSTLQDIPALKLYMKTYLTMVTDGSGLKKYINKVHSKGEENGVQQTLVSASAFYFDNGQLIKVEEYVSKDSREQRMEWCYTDGKPLQYILSPAMTEKEEANMKIRHTELLPIAATLQKAVESKLHKM